MAEDVPIYGLVYNVDDGSLREVLRSEGQRPHSIHKKALVGSPVYFPGTLGLHSIQPPARSINQLAALEYISKNGLGYIG